MMRQLWGKRGFLPAAGKEPWYLRDSRLSYASFLLLLLLPSAIYAFSTTFEIRHQLRSKITRQNLLAVGFAARLTEERLAALKRGAEQGALKLTGDRLGEGDALKADLKAWLAANPDFEAGFVLDTEKKPVAGHPASLDALPEELKSAAGLKASVTGIYRTVIPDEHDAFAVVTPIWDGRGGLVGFFAGQCGIYKFGKSFFGNGRSRGLFRAIVIADAAGRVLFHGRPETFSTRRPGDNGFFRAAGRRPQGVFEAPDPFSGERGWIAFARIDPWEWTVFSIEPALRVLAAAARLPRAILVFGAALFVSFFLLNFLWLGSARRYRVSRSETRDALAYLGAIVESSHEAIVGKKTDGTITSWNKSAEKTYGYTSAEVMGKNFSLLVVPEKKKEFNALLADLGAGKRSVDDYEIECTREDGARFLASVTLSPIRDAGGATVGFSSIVRDVTRRKEEETAFQKIRLDLEDKVKQLALLNRVMMDREERVLRLKEELRTAKALLGRGPE